MTRKNLDTLNDSMSKPRRTQNDPSTLGKINMYKYLEYNRPPTGTGRLRMRDNFMLHQRVQSPANRDLDTIELMANQSSYSVSGTFITFPSPSIGLKDAETSFEPLPPKSPTPPPPNIHMEPPSHPNMTMSPGNQNAVSHNLSAVAQNLQDKIELEFKAQMAAAKEELMFVQKEITDKYMINCL